MPNFRVINASRLIRGSVVSQADIDKHPGLGGTERLLKLGAIEITNDPVTPRDDERSSELSSGSPEPLRKDMDREEALAINRGEGPNGPGDAAAKSHPAKGGPGAVKPAKKSEE